MAVGILVPGVAQTTITFHHNTHRGNMVLHWLAGSPTFWTASTMQVLVDTIMTSLTTRFKALHPAVITYNTVQGVDLSSNTPAQATTGVVAFTCTGGGGGNPGTCAMVNLGIAYRYRGGHPRIYFPQLASTYINTGNDGWTSAGTTALKSAVQGLMADVTTAQSFVVLAVPLYVYGHVTPPGGGPPKYERIALKQTMGVTSVNPSTPYRTQRRRITSGS